MREERDGHACRCASLLYFKNHAAFTGISAVVPTSAAEEWLALGRSGELWFSRNRGGDAVALTEIG